MALLFAVVAIYMAQQHFLLATFSAKSEEQNVRIRGAQETLVKLKVQQAKNAEQMDKVREYDEYNRAWSKTISKYQNTASVLNLISMIAEENHLVVGNRKQQDVRLPVQKETVTEINYEITGTPTDVLTWLTRVEGDVDFLRHYSSSWEPLANQQVFVKIVFHMNFKILSP